jgi:hypothetical protein
MTIIEMAKISALRFHHHPPGEGIDQNGFPKPGWSILHNRCTFSGRKVIAACKPGQDLLVKDSCPICQDLAKDVDCDLCGLEPD